MNSIAEISRFISLVKIDVNEASLELHSVPSKLDISREEGGFEMESHPIELDIDNRAFFDSLGLKSISSFAEDRVEIGKRTVMDSIAQYNKAADMMSMPQNDQAISQIALMQTQKSIETMLAFIPENPPKCHWKGGSVDIEYTPDQVNLHWDIGDVEATYIPYSVHFMVE